MTTEASITFRARDFKGSRLRCLLLTSDAPRRVADFLTSLVAPHARVTAEDRWAPRGFLDRDEPKLGETSGFVNEEGRAVLTRWWLASPGRANTPNWDLISTCRSNDRAGLVLVEAKSHEGELANDQCAATSPENLQRIEMALGEATVACNALTPGFALSANSHYQLSNRVAFAWKLAKMGIPVVLVYLGFIDAHEMRDDYKLLKDHAQWRHRVLAASEGTVPAKAWGSTLDVEGTPLTMLIGSAIVGIHAQSAIDETSV